MNLFLVAKLTLLRSLSGWSLPSGTAAVWGGLEEAPARTVLTEAIAMIQLMPGCQFGDRIAPSVGLFRSIWRLWRCRVVFTAVADVATGFHG